MNEIFKSLTIAGNVSYEYKFEKIISYLEDNLDFYSGDISNIETLRKNVFVNRLIILKPIEIGRFETFQECLVKAKKIDSLLSVRLPK